jgi:phage terminase small subunit
MIALELVAPVQKPDGNAYRPAVTEQQPPSHLSLSAREWWAATVEAYVLQEHHLRLLQLALEAWDRAQAAREQLDREGLTVAGSQGVRPHPCIAIERDSRLAVARLLRELDLDVEPPRGERNAPPPIFSNSNRGGRRAR